MITKLSPCGRYLYLQHPLEQFYQVKTARCTAGDIVKYGNIVNQM